MDPYFFWVEHSAVSTWIRESPSVFAFPSILTLHTLGMGFLAGTNAAMDLRILGFAPSLPLAPMERLFRLMWFAFCVSAASGIGLLIAYPTKALTNPLFYVKLLFVALAVPPVSRQRARSSPLNTVMPKPQAGSKRSQRSLQT